MSSRKKTGVASSPHVYTYGRRIDRSTVDQLAGLLSQPISAALQHQIEAHIGLAIDGARHGNPPSPADYVEEFRKLAQDAMALANKLGGWSYYYTDEFARHGADVHAVEQALWEAVRVAGAVVCENDNKSSPGRPVNWALNSAVRLLAELFDANYKGRPRGKTANRTEFIHIALQAGGAIPEDSTAIKAILQRARKNGNKTRPR